MEKSHNGNNPEVRQLLKRRLHQALMHQREGNLDAARRKCRFILQKAPNHSDALQLMAILMQQSGNTRAALHFMQKALKSNPDNPQLLKNMAEIHRGHGNLERAQFFAQSALELLPDYTDALFVSAAVYLQQDQQEQAIEQFSRLLTLNPDDVEALNSLGNLMCARGDFTSAIRYYHQALDCQPEFHDCRLNLADTLSQSGEHGDAIYHYRILLEADPHNAEIHNRLGQAYANHGESEQASGSFELALELNPLLLEARLNLGKSLLDSDSHQAENWFKSVLDIDPKNVEGYYWLGILFQTLGKFGRASNYLQQAIRIDTEFVPAWFRLSLDRNFEPSEQQLNMLESLWRHRSDRVVSDDNQVSLGFTLGRFYDQRNNRPLAFEYFARSNKLKASRHRFDRELHAAQIEKVIATFNASFFEQRNGWGMDTKTPVFVIGMPRSGTTLVEQILAAHPAIHGAGELRSILQLLESLGADNDDGPKSHAARTAALDSDRVAELAGSLLRQMQTLAPQASRIVDKLPGNYFRLGLIRLLFPTSIIIHCQREPMDTCWSCYQQNFESGLNFSNDLENLGHAYRGYRRLMAHWHHVFPGQIFDLSYEQLVKDPETVCRNLLEHCGMEWQPQVLEYFKQDHPANTASVWQARQPIYQSSIGRWRDYQDFLQPLLNLLSDDG